MKQFSKKQKIFSIIFIIILGISLIINTLVIYKFLSYKESVEKSYKHNMIHITIKGNKADKVIDEDFTILDKYGGYELENIFKTDEFKKRNINILANGIGDKFITSINEISSVNKESYWAIFSPTDKKCQNVIHNERINYCTMGVSDLIITDVSEYNFEFVHEKI